MSNPHPTFRFPKTDTEEGRDFQDRAIDAKMRQTVLRQWLRDEVSNWSDEQVKAYIDDETMPAIRRNFLRVVFNSPKEKTQLQLMEQLDGKARQEIEHSLATPVPVQLEMFGESPKEPQ